jgi:hypothetical protein
MNGSLMFDVNRAATGEEVAIVNELDRIPSLAASR